MEKKLSSLWLPVVGFVAAMGVFIWWKVHQSNEETRLVEDRKGEAAQSIAEGPKVVAPTNLAGPDEDEKQMASEIGKDIEAAYPSLVRLDMPEFKKWLGLDAPEESVLVRENPPQINYLARLADWARFREADPSMPRPPVGGGFERRQLTQTLDAFAAARQALADADLNAYFAQAVELRKVDPAFFSNEPNRFRLLMTKQMGRHIQEMKKGWQKAAEKSGK